MTRAKQSTILSKHRAALDGRDLAHDLSERQDPHTDIAIERAAEQMRHTKVNVDFVLRGVNRSDDNYILDNWTRSYLFSDVSRPVPRDVYNVEQRARIARILRYARVMCAVDPTDKTRIKGWICFQAALSEKHWVTVHYVCVHPNLQNLGIGKQLISVARMLSNKPDDPLWITHYTMPMRRLTAKWNLIYNPYLLEVLHVYD